MFSFEEQVLCAEVLQALQVVNSNYSFASSENDNERFKMMFPDSKIAQSYRQGKTKVRYNIQYGIAPHIKQMLMYDVNTTPFTFKFDESTTSQVKKKQYNAYLQFWSKNYDEVVNCYFGSLFVRHCTAKNLVEHFHECEKSMYLDPSYLLHLGMDGPSVKKSFEAIY